MTTAEARKQAAAQGHQLGAWRRLGYSPIKYAQCARCGATVEQAGGAISGDALTQSCAGVCHTTNRIATFPKRPAYSR
jgi:hypothetical protein